MTRIGCLFERLKRDGRKGLIAYLTAGDPSPERTPALVAALERGGADLIELGVPFSDPIADGPVIQRGGRARAQGRHHARQGAGDRAQDPRAFGNPAAAVHLPEPGAALRPRPAGARTRRQSGIDGCLLTDACGGRSRTNTWPRCTATGSTRYSWPRPPAPNAGSSWWREYSTRLRLPGLAHRRDRRARHRCRTGRRRWSRAMRAVTDLPLAVGFGISTPEHVAELGNDVDAVVVGSAIVRLIEQNLDNPSLEVELESFARALKQRLRSARMNENEARAQAGGVPRADRRCGPAHRGTAERAHARGGRDRPREARSAAADLRAEARRPGFRQRHRIEPRPAHARTPCARIFERIIDEMRTHPAAAHGSRTETSKC